MIHLINVQKCYYLRHPIINDLDIYEYCLKVILNELIHDGQIQLPNKPLPIIHKLELQNLVHAVVIQSIALLNHLWIQLLVQLVFNPQLFEPYVGLLCYVRHIKFKGIGTLFLNDDEDVVALVFSLDLPEQTFRDVHLVPCFDGLDTESGWIKRFWELPVSIFWSENYEFLAFNVEPWERLLGHGL